MRGDDGSPGAGDINGGVNLDQLMNLRVVTASGGVEEEGSMAPASVVVFTRDDIARQGWRSLTDVLENTPGLDVTDDGVMASVGVRGITGGIRASTRIVKVMIDGMAVNFRPDLAALIGPEFIPVEAIDRVEIAKGPLSAIYGANAFLAVVNVITVRAANVPLAAVNLRTNLMRQGPGYGASAFIAESSGPLEIVAAFSMDRSDRSGLRITKTIPNQDVTLPALPAVLRQRKPERRRPAAQRFSVAAPAGQQPHRVVRPRGRRAATRLDRRVPAQLGADPPQPGRDRQLLEPGALREVLVRSVAPGRHAPAIRPARLRATRSST